MKGEEEDDGWVEYFEPEQGYYLYNAETGESKWKEDTEGIDSNFDDKVENEENASLIKDRRKQKRSGFAEYLRKSKNAPKPSSTAALTTAASSSSSTTNHYSRLAACFYCTFHFFNSCCIEAPVLVLESVVRVAFVGFVWLMTLGHGLVTRGLQWNDHLSHCTYIYLREIAITSAVALSVVIPGMILFAYRKYTLYDDWDLAPIPTVLGYADARRFCTIVYGGGAVANNVDYTIRRGGREHEHEQEQSGGGSSASQDYLWPMNCCFASSCSCSCTKEKVNELHHSAEDDSTDSSGGDGMGYSSNRDRDSDSTTPVIPVCACTPQGAVLFVPKDIVHDLKIFLRGDRDSIDSLQIEL